MTPGLGSLGMNVRNFKHEMKNFFFSFFHTQFSKCRHFSMFRTAGKLLQFDGLKDQRAQNLLLGFTSYFVIGLFSAELDREIGPAQETVGTAKQLVTG